MRRTSEETRGVILAAARSRFASDGYDRATIRAIAADARIDPSMVMRYFGSKQGLFAAAADLDLRLPDLAAAPRAEAGRVLAAHLLDLWDDDEDLRILLRTAMTDEGVAERVRGVLAAQLVPAVAAVTPDPATAAPRAGMTASQALGFALCRHVLRLPPVVALTRDEAVAWLAPTFQRYLTGPL
ncbi:TetR/AcrR family transcriptional regulator [Actinomadura rayongensis]|uniref:TetR family transcriptional regulator n=1 Tax=Actinomadura rayongensis TaxID=1429076 RepID=A0A6I4WDF6_9ACTN|nr:TetR family transcriptional regulator [Actinomadura rayongensis]MXQ65866.1 TetR family transcriptional regulator [Actinomadura rayongensis]